MKSIKSRLLFYILLITLIPVVAFFIYSLVFVSPEQRTSEMDKNKTKIEWSAQYLDAVSDQLSDIVYSIQIQPDLLETVEDAYTNSTPIEDTLKDFLYANANLIRNIKVLSYRSNRLAEMDYKTGFNSKALTSVSPLVMLNKDPIPFDYMLFNQRIVIAHTINDFATQENLGLIMIELNDNIVNELDDIFAGPVEYALISGETILLNKTSLTNITLLSNTDFTPKTSNTQTYDIEQKTTWQKTVPSSNLSIISMVDQAQLQQVNNKLIRIGGLIIFITLLTTIPTAIILSNKITNPIIKLVNHMNEFDFTASDQSHPNYDEINLLEESYNHMIQEVNTLIKEQYKYKIDRQDAQLKALQAQINPHFLSNTFQLIGGMALSVDAKPIYDATMKMSHLVRYSMDIEQTKTTLRDELTHITDYLAIQKLRFGDRLKLDITVNKHLKEIEIPKFTLQPIIENAFKHGLKTVEGLWQIKIKSQVTDKSLIIIEDNGIGLDDNTLKTLNQQFKQVDNVLKETPSKKTSIGLKNIDSRIKLLYGDEYGLTLTSSQKGLSVIIQLPRKDS